ncbi:MAG TPA: hypothetical protein VJT73_21710 [Polyangiaceae bacterium]|nr:hypothetical protein [Polyangiaceae bacterium]
MRNGKGEVSELLVAAEAFDQELVSFAKLAEAVKKTPLNSQKNLQRAARSFQEISEAERRLGQTAQTLVLALNDARKSQEVHAQAIHGQALIIEQRSGVAAGLLQRYGAIGEKAAELNTLVLGIASKKTDGSVESQAALLPELGELRRRMAEVVVGAHELDVAAREADFEDIARAADSLRQQVLAADGKVAAIERRIASAR